jgi:hypothetical protein
MVDFMGTRVLGGFRPVPTGRGFYWNLTQDRAALVLGYYRFSLREMIVSGFILPWVGQAGGRLTLVSVPNEFIRSLFSRALSNFDPARALWHLTRLE